jgi:hypothetical protein
MRGFLLARLNEDGPGGGGGGEGPCAIIGEAAVDLPAAELEVAPWPDEAATGNTDDDDDDVAASASSSVEGGEGCGISVSTVTVVVVVVVVVVALSSPRSMRWMGGGVVAVMLSVMMR